MKMVGRRARAWGQASVLRGSPSPPYRGTGQAPTLSHRGRGGNRSASVGTDCFHSNRASRLPPAHQGMKSRSCGLVQRIGTADSATPHPDPSGGQAPALHFLIPPSTIGLQFGTFRRWRTGIEVDWRVHPGSESGTCFRTNRSCRPLPARQGMESRSFDLVQRVGASDSATTQPDPCGGQAPALHYSFPAGNSPQLGRTLMLAINIVGRPFSYQ